MSDQEAASASRVPTCTNSRPNNNTAASPENASKIIEGPLSTVPVHVALLGAQPLSHTIILRQESKHSIRYGFQLVSLSTQILFLAPSQDDVLGEGYHVPAFDTGAFDMLNTVDDLVHHTNPWSRLADKAN